MFISHSVCCNATLFRNYTQYFYLSKFVLLSVSYKFCVLFIELNKIKIQSYCCKYINFYTEQAIQRGTGGPVLKSIYLEVDESEQTREFPNIMTSYGHTHFLGIKTYLTKQTNDISNIS